MVNIMVTPLRQSRGQLTHTNKIKFQTPAYTQLFTRRQFAKILGSKELCIRTEFRTIWTTTNINSILP